MTQLISALKHVIRYSRQNYIIEDWDACRARNPKYPFSEAMQFCSDHDADSGISDVIECKHCKLEAEA